ncbi:hypothetical protein BS78_06G079600 [Paspalum vaginatum]|nr:hypothetical protein BS78_06G079600 [Paspalum vaginatum]
MAVQARYLSHPHACFRALDEAAVPAAELLGDYDVGCARAPAAGTAGAAAVLSGFPRSDLTTTCNYGFEPRKRPRVAGGWLSEDQGVATRPAPAGDVQGQGRALGSGAASTSGRLAHGGDGASVSQPQGLLSRLFLYRQGVEMDALVRLESERLRAALGEAWRRRARAVLAAAERAASGRLRGAEAELGRALRRNAELEEKARQAGAECQAWMGAARSHEAAAAGLRSTLDQLLQSPRAAASAAANEAEDARSCCFEAPAPEPSSPSPAPSCKACGGGGACVLLLPCRHLCLCRVCEPAVDACPVCAAAKNASLHVLLS